MKKKGKKKLYLISAIFIIILAAAAARVWHIWLEGENPFITTDIDSELIGKSKEFTVFFGDKTSGVRLVSVSLLKDNNRIIITEKHCPSKGFIFRNAVYHGSMNLTITPERFGVTDGKCTLSIVVQDNSWRGNGQGNKAVFEKELIIDTTPPQIKVLTKSHNIASGGACLVIYKTSEKAFNSGIKVGDNFFPGYSGYFKNPNIFMAFFALKYYQKRGTKITVTAADEAANAAETPLHCYIIRTAFKNDAFGLSDGFLNRNKDKFNKWDPIDSAEPPMSRFLEINNAVRNKDDKKIREVCTTETEKSFLWKGRFLRLPRAATKTLFGVERIYTYRRKVIDRKPHLGIDLASVAKAKIPAANSGKVVFCGKLNIYGNTIIIDHGFSVFSLYAHLSSQKVVKGQFVKRGQTIGHTGKTGLSSGDHLHFSMIIYNTFVNPYEWWDISWIKNNIEWKLKNTDNLR